MPLNPPRADPVFWRPGVTLRTRLIPESHLRNPVYKPIVIARLAHHYSHSPPILEFGQASLNQAAVGPAPLLGYSALAPTTALSGGWRLSLTSILQNIWTATDAAAFFAASIGYDPVHGCGRAYAAGTLNCGYSAETVLFICYFLLMFCMLAFSASLPAAAQFHIGTCIGPSSQQ